MLRTLTVRQLMEVLENEEPTTKVIVTCDYGDHSHTDQALPLTGDLEYVYIESLHTVKAAMPLFQKVRTWNSSRPNAFY